MKKLILLLLFIPLVSCEQRLSTDELAQEIERDIIEHFIENSDIGKAKLLDFSLIHKGGNEYKGMVDVSIENPFTDVFGSDMSEQEKKSFNIESTYTVEVIYDGESYSWEFLD